MRLLVLAGLAALAALAGCGDAARDALADAGPSDAGCADADVQSDPANCGGCGQACRDEESCDRAVCSCNGHECPDGFGCCAGSCRSFVDDEAHCGRCGNACADGLECAAGECD